MNMDHEKQLSTKRFIILEICSALISLLAMHAMLQLSCHQSFRSFVKISLLEDQLYVLANCSLYALLIGLLSFICGSLYLGKLLSLSLSAVIALINYYTIEWHGAPLTLREIANTGTALNVLGAYKLELHQKTVLILLLFIFSLFAVSLIHILEKRSNLWQIINRRTYSFALTLGLLILWATCWNFIIPEDPVGWSWKGGYRHYGYLVTTIGRAVRFSEPIQKPEGYDDFSLEVQSVSEESTREKETVFPDVIFILNESFYDPAMMFDFKSDTSYLSNYHTIQNSQRGYTVVPQARGGTNKSEYEYLTGNSLQLMPEITPFNVLDLTEVNSVVSYLKNFGYRTVAMHPADPENYSRGYAYRELGFDKIFFQDDFVDLEEYYNRYWATDRSLYHNLITLCVRIVFSETK